MGLVSGLVGKCSRGDYIQPTIRLDKPRPKPRHTHNLFYYYAYPPWRLAPQAASPPQTPARSYRTAAPDMYMCVGQVILVIVFVDLYTNSATFVLRVFYASRSFLLTAGDRHRERSPAPSHAAASALRARETSSAEVTWLWALGSVVARVLNLCFRCVFLLRVWDGHRPSCPFPDTQPSVYVPGLVRQQRHHLGQAVVGALP